MEWQLFRERGFRIEIINGLITAVRTLTVISVPGPEVKKRFYSLPWFVVAGLIVGLVQYYFGTFLFTWKSGLLNIAAFFMVVINYILTGGLHLDGLADSADAFGIVRSREKNLKILKDSHIGVFGAGAIVLGIVWRLISYNYLLSLNQAIWIVYGISLSRIIQGLILLHIPYVRGSEGKAYGYKGPFFISIILIIQLIIFIRFIAFYHDIRAAIIPFCTAILILLPLLILFIRRLGGFTGDCLGAVTEIFEYTYLTASYFLLI
ncbi:MAG: adenosylcobinamide-GDP ribazoletransferase [Fibrobacter sp.]|nr:adenosylcobinamide-GDP ribazoletransferase [Fibrobacter sp.]